MTPEERLNRIEAWMDTFSNPSQLDPQIQRTITKVLGGISLTELSDVTITSPTNTQVLKYNGTIWINDTDAT